MADILPFRSVFPGNEVEPLRVLERKDDDGNPLYCYMLEYEHQGQPHGIACWCHSEIEARLHMLALVATVRYVGRKVTERI